MLSKALDHWSLELVPLLRQSSEAAAARLEPVNQRAFICNFSQHWFTIRRFGHQWFDLNSLMSQPRPISPTFLSLYLAQLEQDGHSIFFVSGTLPDSEADRLFEVSDCDELDPIHHRFRLGVLSFCVVCVCRELRFIQCFPFDYI